MRKAFVDAFLKYRGPSDVFLTGDLGYRTLEPIRDALLDRFINCGIAEQNMVSMAAGLAKAGLSPWVYSIAPFLYARAFEQIRNDICFPGLPVKLIGMSGYAALGPSHQSSEDCAVLQTLPGICVYTPVFRPKWTRLCSP